MFPSTQATTHSLPNGLTVILDPDPTAPVISTQAWIATGSIHEGDHMGAGLSHLLEHMVFKGTATMTGEELSQTVQKAGGQWNAYTTFDRTVYYIDGPADSAETFLKAITEMVFKPTFPENEFEKEKDVIRREIDMGLDDPDSRASRLLFSTALSSDGRAQPVIGHLELFNQISHADMVNYHKTRYTTENTFLAIAGDFNTDEMLETLNNLTAEIPRTFTKPAHPAAEPRQLGKREASETFAIPVSKFTISWQTVTLDHPDCPALDLLSTILGGGKSSRLYQNIREKQNLCLHIGSWSWITPQSPGLFSVSAEVPTEQKEDLLAAIRTEIENITTDTLDAELTKAKRVALVSQFKTLTSASGRASDLASNWHETRNLNFTQNYLHSLDKVTAADIRRVIETYLLTDSTLTITSLDPETSKTKTTSTKTTQQEKTITSHTLSNGLTLHLSPDPRLPIVTIQGATLAGLLTETPDTAGTSTLHATLLTKGTTTRTGAEIATTLETLGATLGASAGNNTSLIGASCLTQDLETVLEILADTLTNPTFPTENLELERQAMLAAIEEENEDPASLAFKTLRTELFTNTGYGIPRLGTPETLAAITSETLKNHHAKYHTATNTNIAIFGDINPEQVIALAEKYLTTIPTGTHNPPAMQPLGTPSEQTIKLDKQQAVLAIGYTGAALTSPDTYALDLIHAWCADMAGPLFTRIREELGLAYYCSATQFHGHTTGLFGFYLGTSPEQIELATTELQNTIEEISTQGIDPETLAAVKTSWLAQKALTNQSNGAMARLCAINTTLGFTTTHHKETAEKIKAVTPAEIQQAAQTYFQNQTPTKITITP